MLVTDWGIVNDDKPVQPLKASAGIIVTFSPMVKFLSLVQPTKVDNISVHFSALNVTDVKPLQPRKA